MVVGRHILRLLVCLASSSMGSIAQDHQLWYERPASKWVEALPIGNGRIGGMVFGGVRHERIQFNEETLWNGMPRDHNRPGAHKYLDTIRHLLFQGRQKEADALAEREFMGLKRADGDRQTWLDHVLAGKGLKGDPSAADFDDAGWKTMTVPHYEGWESVGHPGLDGAVWLRTSFELPADWQGKDLELDLNRIHSRDRTWVNGRLVGGVDGDAPRRYRVPATVLKPGRNIIAIQVINYENKGGLAGYKETSRQIGLYPVGESESKKLSIHGQWKYLIQDDDPPAVGFYQASYQPFGDLYLDFDHTDSADYRRSLDIREAVAKTSYRSGGVTYTREYLVSHPHQAMVVRLSADKPGALGFTASLESPHKRFTVRQVDAQTVELQVKVKGGALRGVSQLKVKTEGGRVSVRDGRVVVEGASAAELHLAAGTNYIDYKNVSGDLNLSWRATPDLLLYGLYARSFKSGGVNLSGIPNRADGTPATETATVEPEEIDHYEAGVKATLLDGSGTLNVSVFRSEIKDYQATVVSGAVGVLRGYLANADEVRTQGAEVDFNLRPADGLSLYVNGAYTDATYVSFESAPPPVELSGGSVQFVDISGDRLPGVSKWSLSFGGEYAFPASLLGSTGEFFLATDGNYRSKWSSNPSPSDYMWVDGYTLLNLRAGFRADAKWNLSIWARNVTDKDYFDFLSVQSGSTGMIAGQPAEQRTYGVTYSIEF